MGDAGTVQAFVQHVKEVCGQIPWEEGRQEGRHQEDCGQTSWEEGWKEGWEEGWKEIFKNQKTSSERDDLQREEVQSKEGRKETCCLSRKEIQREETQAHHDQEDDTPRKDCNEEDGTQSKDGFPQGHQEEGAQSKDGGPQDHQEGAQSKEDNPRRLQREDGQGGESKAPHQTQTCEETSFQTQTCEKNQDDQEAKTCFQ